MITYREAKLIFNLAKSVKDHCIVEIGSYRGRSTIALGLGSLNGARAPVFAIEPHDHFVGVLGKTFGPEDRKEFFKAMIHTGCYQIVRLVNLSSEVVAPNWSRKIGLLWIDGDHSYKAVKRDFECWSRHLAPGALIAFHDSKDQSIGPYQLISELSRDASYAKIQELDDVTVLQLKASIERNSDGFRSGQPAAS